MGGSGGFNGEKSMRAMTIVLGALLVIAGMSAPALAQDAPADPGDKTDAGQNVAKADDTAAAEEEEEPTKPFTFELDLAAVSDYRFRGISLSDKDPAFQPSFTISHQSGLYASVWGSNVADNGGDDIEVDLIAGYATTLGTLDVDVNATYYAYPGADNLDYWEFIGTVSHAVGPATIGGIFAFTPKQDDTMPKRGIYYGINGELPLGETGLALTASYGIEDNAFYDNKRDWSLGVSAEVLGFSLGAAYVGTSHTGGDPLGDDGVVLSVSRAFEF
jgi:uncharacterized protein (TIGR02001 family)